MMQFITENQTVLFMFAGVILGAAIVMTTQIMRG